MTSCFKLLLVLLTLVPTATTNATLRGWTDSQCLATAIHYEARGEPLKGRRAVLDTIHNRMLATGKSACYVIFQRGQFSWANKKPLMPYNSGQKAMLEEVVTYPIVLRNEQHKFFYSGEKPQWAKGMKCRKIGNQNFCEGK